MVYFSIDNCTIFENCTILWNCTIFKNCRTCDKRNERGISDDWMHTSTVITHTPKSNINTPSRMCTESER